MRAAPTYYAAHYPYGVATSTTTGRLVRTVLQFETRADRDAYVAARRTDYRGNSGYREAVRASDVSDRERATITDYSDATGCPLAALAMGR